MTDRPSLDRRRVPRVAAALVVAALVALLVPGGWVAPGGAGAATTCGDTVPDGQVRVVVVVDTGGPQGAGSTCLVVPRGTTGGQLLADRAAALGVPRPRYGDSGLLCAIDGLPATGCGEATASGYRYWAYFSGTSGSWAYGGGNPFIRRVADGDIEGWRFVDGTGTGVDPPPRLAPSAGLFPPLSTAPVPAVPAPPPVSSPAPSGSPAPGPAGVPGATAAAPAGPDLPPAGPEAAPAAAADDGVGVDPIAGASSGSPGAGPSPSGDEVAVAPVAATTSSGTGGSGPWGLVVAAVLVVALTGATIVRARVRR